MTPIVIPLSKDSGWKDPILGSHMELRYFIRSAVENVQDPHFIIVGHCPEWLQTGSFTQQGITSSVRCDHINVPDDPNAASKDANMIRKVSAACEHLLAEGHKGGFIRASDDQAFLKPYTPMVYHANFVKDLSNRILDQAKANNTGKHKVMEEEKEVLMLNWSEHEKRIIATATYFDEHEPLNLDSPHLPIWIKSPMTWLKMVEKYQDIIDQGVVTINTLYGNALFKEICEDTGMQFAAPAIERVNNQKYIRPNALYVTVDNKIDIDLKVIGQFRRDCERCSFLTYNDRGIKDHSNTLKRYLQLRFPTSSVLEA